MGHRALPGGSFGALQSSVASATGAAPSLSLTEGVTRCWDILGSKDVMKHSSVSFRGKRAEGNAGS